MKTEPLEFVFEDISTFDSKNPIVGSLLREPDVEKNLVSDLIKQAPGPPGIDYALKNRLNKLRDRQELPDNNNISPLPSTPVLPPGLGQGPGLPPPPPFIPPLPPSEGFFNSFQPLPPRSDNSFGNFHIPAQLSSASFHNNQGLSGNLFGSQIQVLEREKEKVQDSVQKELDNIIYELPGPPKLELVDGLLNSLPVQADILE